MTKAPYQSAVNTLDFERRLNGRDIGAITGKHRQTIWHWVTTGRFLKPNYINGIHSWTESQIRNWEKNNVQSFEERQAQMLDND